MLHARCRVAFVGPTYGYPPSYFAWRCIRHWANVFDIGPMTVRLKFTLKLDRFCIGPTSNFSNDLACGYLRTWRFIGYWANVFDIGPMTVRFKFTLKFVSFCIVPTSIFFKRSFVLIPAQVRMFRDTNIYLLSRPPTGIMTPKA
jgi:hypothetical protein